MQPTGTVEKSETICQRNVRNLQKTKNCLNTVHSFEKVFTKGYYVLLTVWLGHSSKWNCLYASVCFQYTFTPTWIDLPPISWIFLKCLIFAVQCWMPGRSLPNAPGETTCLELVCYAKDCTLLNNLENAETLPRILARLQNRTICSCVLIAAK